jgi:hydroxypyruvate isomerase
MIRFSANLGFLFTEHMLPDAIRAAADAGFEAVECHFPYAVPANDVRAALAETGLPMLGINTHPGDLAVGEFGLLALPGREDDARAALDEAIAYAAEIDCPMIHAMAGKTGAMPGEDDPAEATFRRNLEYGCRQAEPHGITLLIEGINRHDVPGYHLFTPAHAARTIRAVGASNLRMMFDCYHVAKMDGDPLSAFVQHKAMVGHVQFAGMPDRGDPASGPIDYATLLPAIQSAGYDGFFGAEYKPAGKTEDSLGWMATFET